MVDQAFLWIFGPVTSTFLGIAVLLLAVVCGLGVFSRWLDGRQ